MHKLKGQMNDFNDEQNDNIEKIKYNLSKIDNLLDNVNTSQLVEVKMYANPPEKLKNAFGAVMVLLDQREDWATVCGALTDARAFLNSVKDYNPQKMSKFTHKKLGKYLENPENSSQSIRSASMVAGNMMQWVELICTMFKPKCDIEDIEGEKQYVNDQISNLIQQLRTIGAPTVKLTTAHTTYTAKYGPIFDYSGNVIISPPEVREDPFQANSARKLSAARRRTTVDKIKFDPPTLASTVAPGRPSGGSGTGRASDVMLNLNQQLSAESPSYLEKREYTNLVGGDAVDVRGENDNAAFNPRNSTKQVVNFASPTRNFKKKTVTSTVEYVAPVIQRVQSPAPIYSPRPLDSRYQKRRDNRGQSNTDLFGDFFGFGENPAGCMAKDGEAIDVKKEKEKYMNLIEQEAKRYNIQTMYTDLNHKTE